MFSALIYSCVVDWAQKEKKKEKEKKKSDERDRVDIFENVKRVLKCISDMHLAVYCYSYTVSAVLSEIVVVRNSSSGKPKFRLTLSLSSSLQPLPRPLSLS